MPVKVREMLKRLEQDGWYVARQKGSHRQLKHADRAQLVTLPGHPSDDLNLNTLKSILKQAGYTS